MSAKHRVLVIDDDPSIHEDLAGYLCPPGRDLSHERETAFLFGEDTSTIEHPQFELDAALQGKQGLEMLRSAQKSRAPYSLAFVDMRMPPGWNGLETVVELMKADPQLQIVLCTAFSDYTWQEIAERLGGGDNLLILKKPFEQVEALQMATTLCTKRHLADLAARSREDLENLVRRRTRQLEVARRQAEEAHRAKSRYLVNMSHEMRTPLNAIMGVLDLLQDEPGDSGLATKYSLMRTGGQELMSLINEVLDYSEIESGQLKAEPLNFDLHRLLNELPSSQIALAQDKGIGLGLTLDEEVPRWVRGDEAKLRRVLTNLVNNAVKFTQQGAVTLRAEPLKSPQIRFSVEDTGVGIADEVRHWIFEPYERVVDIRHPYLGTGLGLTICRELVQVMGSEIQLESKPGEGSTFSFVLELPQAKGRPDSDKPKLPRFEGLRVLVVEDNPVNQKVATMLIARLGGSCELAQHGLEALEVLAQKPFDLVLLDCRMPVMDGYEAIERIRASAQPWAQIPVIALTGEAQPEDRQRCLGLGMNGYLRKPVRIAQLGACIERVLGGA